MSRVYLATDRALDRQVVVKTLPADLMSRDAVERFKREIRTAARLQHPNIVPLLAAGEADGVPYFTMPWVEGASLRERLTHGPLPMPEAIDILRDMARALAAAHAKGIVHRDIKPENVLLSSGAALITDFGVARALSEATHAEASATQFQTGTGISVGTPAYMAPEQLAADPSVDHHADIYAWGIVAHELLTGHHPFEGATGTALLHAHLSTTPRPLSELTPAVPSAVANVVRRALEKDPAQRPSSAQEIVDALSTQATPAPARGIQRPSRTRMLMGAAVVVVASVAAFAFAMSRRGGSARDERMIAVAPFRVGGAAEGVRYLREGLGDLMTPQLHSIPGVSSPSMRVMLEQWRRAAGSANEDLPDDRALAVAAAAGAGQVILGEIVGSASHVNIKARLLRVRDGAELAPASVEGPADSVATLASRLVATLLSIRDGGTMQRVQSVMTANTDAITPFLIGEQAYRHGRYAEAGHNFQAAFEHDTTFALAALRIHLTNGWTTVLPGDWLDRAWRNRQHLHGTDSLLLVALAGSTYPAPSPIVQAFRELRRTAEQGNTAELWYTAGDAILHFGSLGGDSLAYVEALADFKRAEALDSSFAPALEHQAMLYMAFGDTAAARRSWQRQRMLDSTGDFFLITDILNRGAQVSDADALAAARRYAVNSPAAVAFAADLLASDFTTGIPSERRLALADQLMRSVAGKPLTVPVGPAMMLQVAAAAINTGRPRSFTSAPGADSALYVNGLNTLAWLVWDGDSATAARSAAELARMSNASADTAYSLARSTSLLTLGLWSLNRGDTAGVERSRAGLRALRAPTKQPWLAVTAAIDEKLLAAHLAVARKSSDARARLIELDSLLQDTPANRMLVLGLGNLLVSRLWEQMGDDQRAWRTITRSYAGIGANGFGSARLRARARIAERIGRRADAVGALREFVALRARADAPYQREVAQARATLAKLERQSTGR